MEIQLQCAQRMNGHIQDIFGRLFYRKSEGPVLRPFLFSPHHCCWGLAAPRILAANRILFYLAQRVERTVAAARQAV
jgi:hypothetical protein